MSRARGAARPLDRQARPGRDRQARPARDRPARSGRAKSPAWAKLLIAFGTVLSLVSFGTIVTEKMLTAAATSGFKNSNLLGSAGNQQAVHHVEINGPLNVLLMGIDERPDQPGTDPSRSDSIIVLHIPAAHDKAYLISIPRDSYVHIPPNPATHYGGGHDKINSAYAIGSTNGQGREGGARLLAATVKELTGTGFDAAVIVNFGGFQDLVSALGGVSMCVDERTVSVHIGHDRNGRTGTPYDQSSGHPVLIRGMTPQVYEVGCRTFAAWEALDYVRQRELLPDGDYGRQRHQQQFLKAVFSQALSRGVVGDPGKLKKVLDAAGQALTLDIGGVGIDDWLYSLRSIGTSDLVTIRTNAGQFTNRTVNGQSVEDLTDDTMQLLHSTATDTVDAFLATHQGWIIDGTASIASGSATPQSTANPPATTKPAKPKSTGR